MAYKTKRSRDARVRLKALENGDEFAKLTFLALRKDDSCKNRLLRLFGFKKPQDVVEIGKNNDKKLLKEYNDWLLSVDSDLNEDSSDRLVNKFLSL
jgi:hypothetical protein